MDTDFKVWLRDRGHTRQHILEPDGTVRVNFIDFAFSCGLATKPVDSRLRKRFSDSLTRIQHTHFQFIKNSTVEGKKVKIGMRLVSTSWRWWREPMRSLSGQIRDLNTLYVSMEDRLYLKILKTLSEKNHARHCTLLVELPDHLLSIRIDR